MADLSRILKTIEQYMPSLVEYLLQNQQTRENARIWLEKSLQESRFKNEEQRKTAAQQFTNELVKAFLNPEFFKPQTLPGLSMLEHASRYFPEALAQTGTTYTRGEGVPQIENALSALAQISRLRQAGEPIPEETARSVASFFGPGVLGENVADIVKQKEGAAQRAVKGRELDIEEKRIPLLEREVGAREAEIGLEKAGGKTAKELKKDKDKLMEDRDSQVQKLFGVGVSTLAGKLDPEQAAVIMAKIDKIDRALKEMEKKTGEKLLPDESDHEEFLKQAQSAIQNGGSVNWQLAAMRGFDVYWLNKVRELLEKKRLWTERTRK
jgi:hypothetical protein